VNDTPRTGGTIVSTTPTNPPRSSAAASQRPLAVVTGASTGIGYELAKQFAAGGFDVVLIADEERVEQAAQDVEAIGERAWGVRADLRLGEDVELAYRYAAALGRPIEALVVNAGVGVYGPFATAPLGDQLRLIDLNVRGAVHLAGLAVPGMVERGQGRLLFTSSIAALQPTPLQAVYAASKSFLFSFSEALRNELKGTGVTVTALLPGPTDTNFFERAGMEHTRLGSGPKDDPAEVAHDAFEALMAGKDHVVAGSLRNSVMAGLSKVTPERVKAQVAKVLSAPSSKPGG
jgi:short-subunit dehydrogenase